MVSFKSKSVSHSPPLEGEHGGAALDLAVGHAGGAPEAGKSGLGTGK